MGVFTCPGMAPTPYDGVKRKAVIHCDLFVEYTMTQSIDTPRTSSGPSLIVIRLKVTLCHQGGFWTRPRSSHFILRTLCAALRDAVLFGNLIC